MTRCLRFSVLLLQLLLLQILQGLVIVGAVTIPSSFECLSPGNSSLDGSCIRYIECLEEGNGVLAPILQSCDPGLAFSPLLDRCLDAGLVKGCNVTLVTSGKVHAEELDHLCIGVENDYVCANCKTLINCINGKAYPISCPDDDYCSMQNNKFDGGVCYPNSPKSCVCLQSDVFYQDMYDPGTFFVCDSLGERQMHHCPDGYVFDRESIECRSETGLPTCTHPGTYAVEADCSRYYACIVTTEGWLQHEFKCQDNEGSILFYNEHTGICDNPCDWPSPDFECQEEGRFMDPRNCRNFYVCTRDPETQKFRKVQRQCPEGYEWQQVLRTGIGLCSLIVNHECTQITNTRCTIPPALCPKP